MRYIYTHQSSRITIDADSELKAAKSFKEIAESFFPEKVNVRWDRETQEFYARPDVAPKMVHLTQKETATIKARAPQRKVRMPRVFAKPFRFE